MEKNEVGSAEDIKKENLKNIETIEVNEPENEVEEVLFEQEIKITGEAVMEFNIKISTKK